MSKCHYSGKTCTIIIFTLVMQLSGGFIAMELFFQKKYDLISWMIPIFFWFVPVLGIMVLEKIKKK